MRRMIERNASALVLVDYQTRLLPAIHHGARALAHALLLADIARLLGVPVIGTEQNAKGLGASAEGLRERCGRMLAKMHFDACADGLLEALPERSEVVIAGCESHVCLMQTALGLLQAGRKVSVVAPACGSRAAENHELAMQRLRQAGAVIVSVEMVAFEWLRTCEDEGFRPALALLKAFDPPA